MPFRSGSFWSVAASRHGVLLTGALALAPSLARAAMTVTARNTGSISGTTFYLAGSPNAVPNPPDAVADTLGGFSFLDLCAYQSTAPSPAGICLNSSGDKVDAPDQSFPDQHRRPNAIKVNIATTFTQPTTLTSGQVLALVMKVYHDDSSATTGTTFAYAPIAVYHNAGNFDFPEDCTATSCFQLGLPITTTHYFGVPIKAQKDITIGFYPRDICNDATVTGSGGSIGTVGSCNGSGVLVPVNQTTPALTVPMDTAKLSVRFQVVVLDSPAGGPTTAAPLEDSGVIRLNFQADAPTLDEGTCPASILQNIYTPGDGRISLNTGTLNMGEFQANAPTTLPSATPSVLPGYHSTSVPADRAPRGAIMVLAQESPTDFPSPTSGGSGEYFTFLPETLQGLPVVGRDLVATPSDILNFKNTTPPAGADHFYQIQLVMRDAAGMMSVLKKGADGNPVCRLSNVQVSEIHGFLKEGKCFIATAAYGTGNAAAVKMLRRFRDQILLNFAPGRAFVSWYYAWSPDAAEWLLRHPFWRGPVLVLLAPLELFAWLILHPWAQVALFLGLLMGVATLLAARLLRLGAPE